MSNTVIFLGAGATKACGGPMTNEILPAILGSAGGDLRYGVGHCVVASIRLRGPPALAVALLPMAMHRPTVVYPFAVLIGTALVAGWFAVFEMWTLRQRQRVQG